MKILWIILIGIIIYFSLPSTMYRAVFRGIFKGEETKAADLNVLCRGDAALRARYQQALEAFSALEFQDVWITSDDGLRLHGRYFNQNRERLVIFVHGYRTRPETNFALQIQDFLAHGYDLLIIDQRAHGESEGKYVGMGHLEQRDVLQWIDWASHKKIAVYGMSMGGAAVGHASGKIPFGKVRALVMDCGFSNFYDELNYKCELKKMLHLGFAEAENRLAKRILQADLRESTAASLARTEIPVFFFHGSEDVEVPIREMHRQFAACASEKEAMIVNRAPHTLAYGMGGKTAEESLFAFLDQWMK